MRLPAIVVSTLVALLSAGHASAQLPEPHNDPETGAMRRGALSGASIFVSPGHGWYYTPNGWITQRGNSHGIVEDHSNAESVIQYLLPYLENAGARVYMARERDMQTNMVIVEPGGEGYTERGEWQEIEAPGAHNGKLRWTRAVDGIDTASATYTPEFPADGYYAVYAWYRPHTRRDTVTDARFIINHTGGTTVWQQDLNRDGHTWKYLGTYWFDAGANEVRGSVVLLNQSASDGDAIIAPAIRFGGGVGDLTVGKSERFPDLEGEAPPPSGKPRWEESGHTYSLFMGFDPTQSTVRFNQVWAMPLWAQWESEAWEKDVSVYLSWHTNGSIDHQVRGLSTYIYGEYAWGPHDDFSGYPGGVELANAVHDRVITVMRKDWDPQWEDVGKVTRWLGETNPRPNPKMPALLVENGFHDNVDDAAAILEPDFRDAAAKGVMQGLIDYYSQHVDGFNTRTYPPETPANLRITTNRRGEVTIAWDAPPHDTDGTTTLGHRATGYRVYRSLNGMGFDNGFDVRDTSFRARTIVPGEVAYYRVTATNAGGESKPTQTLAVRQSIRDRPGILFVNGYNRLDRGLNIIEEGGVERGILSRMNAFNYVRQHAAALAQIGEDFDSASNGAVIAGHVSLSDYKMVIWALGRESTTDRTFDETEQSLIRDFIAGDGVLFASGTDIGTDLSATAEGTKFLAEVFGARHTGRAKGKSALRAAHGADIFRFGEETDGAYPVKEADVFTTLGSASSLYLLDGTDQSGTAAALKNDNTILLSIPFESITGSRARSMVMETVLDTLLGEVQPPQVSESVAPATTNAQHRVNSTGG